MVRLGVSFDVVGITIRAIVQCIEKECSGVELLFTESFNKSAVFSVYQLQE
jgi:hypothetical protein